ncbi:hypothetical protein GCM10010269_35480 [Streptomyces humidus]|uniref:Uncharacterized protein n=1 Tax=Streptomyces humidus TaxID=52259 RepID=A0A918FW06_9ACTN|nr:hypothetical protein GCM10010269_35480 [Streptomyces humidus]
MTGTADVTETVEGAEASKEGAIREGPEALEPSEPSEAAEAAEGKSPRTANATEVTDVRDMTVPTAATRTARSGVGRNIRISWNIGIGPISRIGRPGRRMKGRRGAEAGRRRRARRRPAVTRRT